MFDFGDYMDLTGKDRKITCKYYGPHRKNIEGRVFSETPSGLIVGVSLWEIDVLGHHYDPSRNSLDIVYKRPSGSGARAGMSFTKFDVPADIEQMNVYHWDHVLSQL